MAMNEAQSSADAADWSGNYFNYFTEVEEHFRRARGTALFLLSPLDWALIENWRIGGVPLDAVLRGIDEAFEKWRSRKVKRKLINSVAYCAQAVMEAANRAPSAAQSQRSAENGPFTAEELSRYLRPAAECLRVRPEPALKEVGVALSAVVDKAQEHLSDLEQLEQRLSAMEDKIAAALRASQTEEELLAMRRALDSELKPYRGKINAEQLAMLERRYLDNALFERAGLKRLSLFYLR